MSASSMVRSRSVWMKPADEMTSVYSPSSAVENTRAATSVPRKPMTIDAYVPTAAPARRRRTVPSISAASVVRPSHYTRPVRRLPVLILAATIPIVFLHVRYQPSVVVGPATVKLSDVMVLLTALAAVGVAVRDGLGPLRPGRPVWIAGILFLLWIGIATLYPSQAYPFKTHAVTAGEFAEYALLASAVPLLVRRRADALLVLAALVAWSVAATVVGALQWAGWEIAAGWGQGQREPSFLGTQDFA